MKKLSPKAKTILIYILSFLLPGLMMMAIYASIGITYGGKVTILGYDLKAQYAPFIAGLRYLLEDPGKILFNWNASMGGNFMGVFAYYLASPLNLITLFWKVEDIANAMYVLVILKIALCGLTFNTFLHKRHPEREISFYNLAFSLCYALMSYNMAYGMCVMWMDAIILFPIVLLGVEKILAGKKGGLFFISITLTFITNYYMSYMVGIFALLYFMCGIFSKINKDNVKYYIGRALCFSVNSLLGLGISMPLILPSIINLKYRYIGGETIQIDKELSYEFHPLLLIKKFLPSQYDTMFCENGNPYVFCGSLILILAFLYFFQKRERKNKILSLTLLLIVFSGFIFEKMDYFWHGFTYPTSFPYRYSFLFSGLIIILSYESFIHIMDKHAIKPFIISLLFVYTILEMYMNGNAIHTGIYQEVNYDIRKETQIQNNLYSPIATEIRNIDTMYRMHEQKKYYSYNIEVAYGLNGLDFYSSYINTLTRDFVSRMGGAAYSLFLSGYGFTPLTDSLFGMDYIIGTHNLSNMYEEIYTTNELNKSLRLFRNPESLGLGFMSKEKFINMPEWCNNPFSNQIKLLTSLGVDGNGIYQSIPCQGYISNNGNLMCISIEFDVNTDDSVYYYFDSMLSEESTVVLYLNDKRIAELETIYIGTINELPKLNQGKNILRIEGPLCGEIEIDLASFNKEAYLVAMEQLKTNKIENVYSKGNTITGTIDAGIGGTLFTTIPYDDGFSIYVDGIKTNYNKALNTFISLELSPGTHDIKFIYTPPGLILGIIIMCISLLGISVYYRRKY